MGPASLGLLPFGGLPGLGPARALIDQLGQDIRSLDWWWVTAAVLCDLLVYVVHAWRWNILLEPVAKLRLWRTVQSIYVGLFANEVLPLRVGELIRCYLLAHWSGLNLSVVFASAAIEWLIDGFWLLAAFLIATIFVKKIPEDLTVVVVLVCALVAVGAVSLVWVVMHKQHARHRDSREPVGRRPAARGGRPTPDGQPADLDPDRSRQPGVSAAAVSHGVRLDAGVWAGLLLLGSGRGSHHRAAGHGSAQRARQYRLV